MSKDITRARAMTWCFLGQLNEQMKVDVASNEAFRLFTNVQLLAAEIDKHLLSLGFFTEAELAAEIVDLHAQQGLANDPLGVVSVLQAFQEKKPETGQVWALPPHAPPTSLKEIIIFKASDYQGSFEAVTKAINEFVAKNKITLIDVKVAPIGHHDTLFMPIYEVHDERIMMLDSGLTTVAEIWQTRPEPTEERPKPPKLTNFAILPDGMVDLSSEFISEEQLIEINEESYKCARSDNGSEIYDYFFKACVNAVLSAFPGLPAISARYLTEALIIRYEHQRRGLDIPGLKEAAAKGNIFTVPFAFRVFAQPADPDCKPLTTAEMKEWVNSLPPVEPDAPAGQ